MAVDFPTSGDKREIGQIVGGAVELAYEQDSVWPRAIARAMDRYLRGERNFRIPDPYDTTRTLIEVELEDGYPVHAGIVSDVNEEIGKQQCIDISPTATAPLSSIQGARNKAVSQGILSYHFSDRVISDPNRMFQRGRVINGCAGLAVCPTIYPGFGWGLKIIYIPIKELVFLPIGCDNDKADVTVWRQWLPIKIVNREIEKLAILEGSKIRSLPSPESEDYRFLELRDVPYGQTVDDYDESNMSPGGFFDVRAARTTSDTGKKKTRTTKFVLFQQLFFSTDRRHLDRKMIVAGKYLVWDKVYPEFERPICPVRTAVYADVGGPYGSSYAFAKLGPNMRNETVLNTLMRNYKDTDAYGIIAISAAMGMNIEDMFKVGNGCKVITYATDPNAQNAQPLQIAPIQMDRIARSMGVVQAINNEVYPRSPLDQGRSVGRVDSDAAVKRISQLGQTSIRAGAESSRACWNQMYSAGLEMAREHHREGDKIPMFIMTPDLAGVIVDVEELPLSKSQKQKKGLEEWLTAERSREMESDVNSDLDAYRSSREKEYIPVPRFTIGPNTIPSPNEISIDIRSMAPRDEEGEFAEIVDAIKLGACSIMEAQIEVLQRGLKRFFGGRIVQNTYRTAVLNLLSAFGDGIEAGPIVAAPQLFVRLVGYWVISSFVADPLFGLASRVVQNRVLQLLYMYNPSDQTGGQPSADEAAAIFAMQQKQQMAQQKGMQQMLPQV